MSNSIAKRNGNAVEGVKERNWMSPQVDIFENDSELLLLADVPGVTREDLCINLDKDQLTIEGGARQLAEQRALGCEFRAVDYRRKFVVPPGIDGSKISAELKDGVLSLRLPKPEALKPRQIHVQTG